MGKTQPPSFQVTWTIRASNQLARLLNDAHHAQGNPRWVANKLKESIQECERRLGTFPDLRPRYFVRGLWCNAITLQCFPAQLFFRHVGDKEVTVFFCRPARCDRTKGRMKV